MIRPLALVFVSAAAGALIGACAVIAWASHDLVGDRFAR